MKLLLYFSFILLSITTTANYRISLLTCGTGEELYASFGHSAIRIIDSSTNTDKVYNYGMFNFGDPNFYSKFVRGKLLYYADEENFESFFNVYEHEGRSITEQVLNLDSIQANALLAALKENLKEENKYYKYDFLFDNCSTRIRDIFSKSLGNSFAYSNNTSTDSLPAMHVLNSYLKQKHWERVGINLILSNKVNQKMTTSQSMFLPDGLMDGVGNAKINGRPFVLSTNKLTLAEEQHLFAVKNKPQFLFWLIAAVFFVLSLLLRKKKYFFFLDALLFTVLGLLGCLFLFMWFGTDHITTYKNYNLLWASPLLLVLCFGISRSKKWVSKLAIVCLITASIGLVGFHLVVHYIPLEVIPIILILIYRLAYYAKFRKNSH